MRSMKLSCCSLSSLTVSPNFSIPSNTESISARDRERLSALRNDASSARERALVAGDAPRPWATGGTFGGAGALRFRRERRSGILGRSEKQNSSDARANKAKTKVNQLSTIKKDVMPKGTKEPFSLVIVPGWCQ